MPAQTGWKPDPLLNRLPGASEFGLKETKLGVGQASSLTVYGASLPHVQVSGSRIVQVGTGGRMPPEPSGWKPDPHHLRSPSGWPKADWTRMDLTIIGLKKNLSSS